MQLRSRILLNSWKLLFGRFFTERKAWQSCSVSSPSPPGQAWVLPKCYVQYIQYITSWPEVFGFSLHFKLQTPALLSVLKIRFFWVLLYCPSLPCHISLPFFFFLAGIALVSWRTCSTILNFVAATTLCSWIELLFCSFGIFSRRVTLTLRSKDPRRTATLIQGSMPYCTPS